ncbi:alpha/beta fold hydrolase [Desertimonas flava]|uniref:alpha/beta fold hydrolase n=1 Tax=Desertimonas flava TaxID=2064846 RepID=UPI000E3442E8
MYEFSGYALDSRRYELTHDGDPVHVEPQVFDVLVHLIEHRDSVVSKHDLLDSVWGDRFVSESALTSRLKAARRAVGDDGTAQRVIRTVFGRGYQFVAPVVESASLGDHAPASAGIEIEPSGDAADATVPSPEFIQRLRFCTADDGTRLAYATSGSGPVLVKAANWMTHIDLDVDSAVWGHWLRDLSAGHTLIRYDERGCGLSDWDIKAFSFDDWVDDLKMVVDDAGLDRFPLLGISQGAAVAVAFAARYPERVSRLVLVSSYGRGRMVRARNDAERRVAFLDLELARVGWQRDDPSFRQVFTSQFFPDGSQEQWESFNELQRRTTSPENAVEFLTTFGLIDVTDLAPLVRCPTLFVHSRGDQRQPLIDAKALAALIDGSEMVALPSRNHLPLADEPAWPQALAAIEAFLAAPDGRDDAPQLVGHACAPGDTASRPLG